MGVELITNCDVSANVSLDERICMFLTIGTRLGNNRELVELWILIGSNFNIMGMSMVLVYPYSLLPGLREPDSTFVLDLETESWLVTSATATYVIGSLLTACLMEVWGRRLTHGLFILPAVLSWLLTYFSSNITTLMIARCLGGMGAGSPLVVGSAIIGEYSTPEYRGLFSAMRSLAIPLACLSIHLLGTFFHWRTVALLSITPSAIAICMNFTWPESPSWLATKGRYKKSEEAFFWLRGKDEKSVREFVAMVQAQKERLLKINHISFKDKLILFVKKFRRRSFVKPILISCIGYVLIEFSARNVFPAFAMDIIGDINIDMKSKMLVITIIIDVLVILCSCVSCYLAKILKRRTQLFLSGLLSLTALSIFCIYLYLESKDIILKDKPWIPVSMLMLFFSLTCLGVVSIPITLFGEIFPLADKGSAIAVSAFIRNIPMVICFKITPGLLAYLKVYGTFAVYGCVMAVSLWFLYVTLPETTNRTLQEIEEFFNHGRFLDDKTSKSLNDEETSGMLREIKTERKE